MKTQTPIANSNACAGLAAPTGSPPVYCGECGGEHEPSGARSTCILHWKRRAVCAENEANVLKTYGEAYWKKMANQRGEDLAAVEAALVCYGKLPDDVWIGTNSTADRVQWLVGRCAGSDKAISIRNEEAHRALDTINGQRKRIQEIGEMLTEYQTMLFCLARTKGNEGGLRIDRRNNNPDAGAVLRFQQCKENPHVTVVTVEANRRSQRGRDSRLTN